MLRYIIGNKIDRYFYKELLFSIVLVYVGVLSIFIMLDFANNSDFLNATLRSREKEYEEQLQLLEDVAKSDTASKYLSKIPKKPTYKDIVITHYLSQLPFLIYLLTPIVTTLAVSFTVIRMSGTNEFLILKTSGIPVRRVLRPAMTIMIAVSAALLAYNTWGLTYFVKMLHENRVSTDRSSGFTNLLTADAEGMLLYVGSYKLKAMHGEGVYAIDTRSDEMTVTEADTLDYVYGKGWVLGKGLIRAIQNINTEGIEYRQMRVIEEFEKGTKILDFNIVPTNMGKEALMLLEEKSIPELQKLVEKKPFWTAPKVQLHRNIAFPFAPLLLFMITISLVLNNQNRNMLVGVGLSIVFSFGFYGVIIIASGAAIQGDIAADYAILSAAMPFTLLGLYLYMRIKS